MNIFAHRRWDYRQRRKHRLMYRRVLFWWRVVVWSGAALMIGGALAACRPGNSWPVVKTDNVTTAPPG